MAWYKDEKRFFESNGPMIEAHDSHTEKYLQTFASYDDFRSTWPSAEIVGWDFKDEYPGEGCIVYC